MNQKPNKRIVVDISGRYSMNMYLDYLLKAIVNVGLIILLMRWIDLAMYDNRMIIVIFALLFSIIEDVFTKFLHRHYGRYILQTFGTILILSIILSMSLAYFIVSNKLIFYTMDTFFGFVVMFMLVRKTLSIFLMLYINQWRIHKLLEKEVHKDV